jgi:hypothetical protein
LDTIVAARHEVHQRPGAALSYHEVHINPVDISWSAKPSAGGAVFSGMDSDNISFLLFHDDHGHWFAAPPAFQTLLRHPIGRGSTRGEAIADLLAHPEFIHRAKKGEWSPDPRLADFVEVPAPKWTTWTPFMSVDFLAEAADEARAETTRAPGRGHAGGADVRSLR